MAEDLKSVLSAIRLTGSDNFPAWKYQIEIALIAKDLWDYVSGNKVAPEAPQLNVNELPNEFQIRLQNYTKESAEFKKGNAQALFIMTSAIDTKHILRINTLKTAKAVFDDLCTMYDPVNAGNRCSTLFTKLYT